MAANLTDNNTSSDNAEGMSTVLALKIVAIFVVFISGVVGAAAPIVYAWFTSKDNAASKTNTTRRIIKILTCAGVGVIVATALIHMLPEGIVSLKESGNPLFKGEQAAPSNTTASGLSNETTTTAGSTDAFASEVTGHGEDGYPYGMLFALIGLCTIYFISTELNWYAAAKMKELRGVQCDAHEEERQGAMIRLWVMEIGIAVHSVIIGITLGITTTETTTRVLTVVLCIHQAVEGVAVSTLAILAEVSFWQAVGFVTLFGATTSVGIGIGIAISAAGAPDGVALGVLQTLSAGILLHMALVDMLPHALGSHSHHAHGPLPLAQVHDHLHHHDHNHDHDHDAVAPAAVVAADSNPLAGADTGAAKQDDGQEMTNVPSPVKASGEEQQSPASQPVAGEQCDDHKDDESFCFRFACYSAIVIGAAIQAVLGIWA